MEYKLRIDKHKACSTNTLRSAQRWASHNLKKKYSAIYNPIIKSMNIPPFEGRVQIDIFYNSRLDPDNVSGKFIIDAFVECGVIKDDSKKYVKRFSVENLPELPSDTYIIRIRTNEDGNQARINF